MSTAVDLKTKEEKDAELDRRIEALRKKNEALVKRYQEIEEDKKKAEQEGIAVTTARKPRPHDGEPDRRRTEKENFTVTVDLSRPAGQDKRSVMNDWKSGAPPRGRKSSEEGEGSPPRRAGSGRLGRGGQRGGGARHERREPRPDRESWSEREPRPEREPRQERETRPERPSKEGETGEGPGMSRRGGRRGGRDGGGGREGGGRDGGGREGGGREGGGREGVGAPQAGSGGDRKSKEWEEKRRLNIEKMNEEMEKIAEYERGQRGDGDRPIRNFLDDPRRSGPVPDIDRKEGSRRHVRNWGGLDFENVKTGAEMEKEWSSRRPGPKGTDMTMSMTGRERAEYLRWKKEREQIDEERLARHRNATGQWRREWDAQKTDTMFKDDPAVASEGSTPDHGGRRARERSSRTKPPERATDDSKHPPKAPTFGDFLGQGRGREGGRGERTRGRGQSKSYSMHDNRWEGEKEDEEEKSDKPKKEERTKEEKTRGSSSQKAGEKNGGGEEDEDEWEDASDGEEEEISGDDDSEGEEEGRKDRESQKEKTRKKKQTANSLPSPTSPPPPSSAASPRQQRTPRPKVHIPPPQAAQDSPEGAKPLSPFTPLEGHQPVSDWGEEMEMMSPRSSLGENPLKPPSAKSSPPQAQSQPSTQAVSEAQPEAQAVSEAQPHEGTQVLGLEKRASSVEKEDMHKVVVSEPEPENPPALETTASTQPASSPSQAPSLPLQDSTEAPPPEKALPCEEVPPPAEAPPTVEAPPPAAVLETDQTPPLEPAPVTAGHPEPDPAPSRLEAESGNSSEKPSSAGEEPSSSASCTPS